MKKIKLIITLLSSIFALLIIISCTSNLTWAKTFGNNSNDYLFSIQQTTDNGYILVGENLQGILIIKLNIAGCILWQKIYGDITYRAESIQQTTDGGYIVGGNTNSSGAGDYDFIVLKLDENGIIQWQKAYGGSGLDIAYSIKQISDGGYIIAGQTDSYGAGGHDIWFLKLDANGFISDDCSSQDASITPANSSIIQENIQVTISNTGCTEILTNAIPQDLNIVDNTQCINN